MNEPDDDAKWSDATRAYLREAQLWLREWGAEQLVTVGMTWRVDRISEAGLPGVVQYHEYCPKRELFDGVRS